MTTPLKTPKTQNILTITKKIFKCIFSITFLIISLKEIGDSVLSFAMLLTLSIVLFPPLENYFLRKVPHFRYIRYRYATYIVLFLAGVLTAGGSQNERVEEESVQKQESLSQDEVKMFNLGKVYYDANGKKVEPKETDITYRVVEVLDHKQTEAEEEKFNSENFHFLVKVNSYKEEDLKKIVFAIKDDYARFAPNNCNIDLWDDKKAYQLYLAQQKYYRESFNELMDEFQRTGAPIGDKHQQLKEKWDKRNYPFIADHLPASISLGNDFQYYQLQDDYYKKVGGKNYKK